MPRPTFYQVSVITAYIVLYLYYPTYKKTLCMGQKPGHMPLQVPADLKESQERVTRDLDSVMKNLIGENTKMTDSKLLKVLRHSFIEPPSQYVYKLLNKVAMTSQAEIVKQLTNDKRGGFFVECGGFDGEQSSNTIYLEQKLGWSGLLVEMDPSWYQQLRGKNRKSFSMNACMSPFKYPIKMNFTESKSQQGEVIFDDKKKTSKGSIIRSIYCFPFYSMMLALNRTHIDYFSLDVEGLELEVLRTIPFHKIGISILTVEYIHGREGKDAYLKFMESVGYLLHSVLKPRGKGKYANDFVFTKK